MRNKEGLGGENNSDPFCRKLGRGKVLCEVSKNVWAEYLKRKGMHSH